MKNYFLGPIFSNHDFAWSRTNLLLWETTVADLRRAMFIRLITQMPSRCGNRLLATRVQIRGCYVLRSYSWCCTIHCRRAYQTSVLCKAASMDVGEFFLGGNSGFFQGQRIGFFHEGPTVMKFHFIHSKLREIPFLQKTLIRKHQISKSSGGLATPYTPFRCPHLQEV